MEMDKLGVVTSFIHNIVVYNIPLLYGTVGEIMVEKSGSLNLGVEGIMAVGAIFGYIVGCFANSLAVGILVAFLTAALCGLLFALLTVSLQANQNITGLTLTTFGLGVYFFVGNGLKAKGWPVMSNFSNIQKGFSDIALPGLSRIPVIGHGFFNHNVLVYLGVILAVAMWWYLNRTTPGLKLRAVGENPGAADSVGINVKRMKYLHICLGCGIMGIGGYYMGLNMSGSFNSSCWINGYGWIAVALVIFANWNPNMAILGTFVFGFFNTLRVSGNSLAAAFPGALGWLAAIPTQVYQSLPFVITAVVLVLYVVLALRHTRWQRYTPLALGWTVVLGLSGWLAPLWRVLGGAEAAHWYYPVASVVINLLAAAVVLLTVREIIRAGKAK